MTRANRFHLLVAVFLLWLAFTLTVIGAARTSITTAESVHIGSGHSVPDTGEWRMLDQHPPLVHELATWPLLLIPDQPSARGAPGWAEAYVSRWGRFLASYRPIDRVVFPVRVPIAPLSARLGTFVYRWATDWRGAGGSAGLLGLGLYALDLNILGGVCFAFIALYFFQRFLRRPTLGRMVVAGIALGLSQASKNSAILLRLIIGLLRSAHALIAHPSPMMGRGCPPGDGPTHPTRRAFFVRLMLALAAMLFGAFLSLWAIYGFEVEQPPGWPWAVPAGRHMVTLLSVWKLMGNGYRAFLWGQVRMHGWWWFFPSTFAVKTLLPTLILLATAIAFPISSLKYLHLRCAPAPTGAQVSQITKGQDVKGLIWRGAMLGAFPVLFFLSAPFGTLNTGYRYLPPVIPFSHSRVRASQAVELETLWRVNQPPAGPFSLMAHLLDKGERAVSVGDGLGMPVENWQVGDIIVQRHVLTIPPGTAPETYWVHVGAYTLANLHRLAVEGQAAADRIVLTRLEVVD